VLGGYQIFRYPPEPDITTDPHKGLIEDFNGWTIGAGYQVFLNSGSHRFENSWASPAGSHQPVVTYDLQLVQKDKLNFQFFPIEKSELT
jgi:hypothetical protein